LRGNNCIKETAKKQRENFQLEGKNIAKQNIPLHMAGCMLYWAEGSKDRNSCVFSNSDQYMLKFFLTFLYECYNLNPSNIKIHITCHTNNGITVEDIEKYWSETLGIPLKQFTKTTTNILSKYSFEKKTKNKLLYGTVQLKVHSTKLVQNIFGAIQEYANFEYKTWLE
jgi:hypothetical protein